MQIVKEPISTKGPRLTSELSFAGRYLVLIPFNDKVSVSQKIKSSEERARLKQLLMSIKPKNFGVTSAPWPKENVLPNSTESLKYY